MAYPKMTGTQYSNLDTPEMHAIMECLSICKACAKKCIEEGHQRIACLCNDCAELCDLAVKFKSCNSEWTQQVLDLCGNICRQCANECGRMQSRYCQECAEACRRSAEACSLHPSYR
ncbi:four-helix bundle copper-binding protein [Candidatus Protochlamydia phocaeensis]|uniref:four-helix bundle copper-binding protein n=1 Tax=Candidatus Protochlamydia phocaeensis TaxID=1414722 RepID=UPI000838010B|nr:four-helix bundle copper-binding protein [Candidatus Protochlamydia phocaeensis]